MSMTAPPLIPETPSSDLSTYLKRTLWVLGGGWTLVVLLSYGWNAKEHGHVSHDMAEMQARTVSSQLLASLSSASSELPVNPHSHSPDLGHNLAPESEEIGQSHSQCPLDRANDLTQRTGFATRVITPLPSLPSTGLDPWETKALADIGSGKVESAATVIFHQEPHLRLMRPLVADAHCQRCHEPGCFPMKGPIGGVSIALPMAPFLEVVSGHARSSALIHLLFWAIGTTAIILGIGGLRHQIEKRQRAEATVQHLVSFDQLTGLPNRALFLDRLGQAIAHAHRNTSQLAILYLDLDSYKKIASTLGHQSGDQLLGEVATRLGENLREGETLARLEGGIFGLILATSTQTEAVRGTQRIRSLFKAPFTIEGQDIYLGTSIGVATYPQSGNDPQTLLKHADTAMQQARRSGRNSYRFFNPAMNARASEWMQLEGHLRRALERNEFSLAYQPQVECETLRIAGVEALVRWEHPELGTIPPDKFIPLAEETGLTLKLGEWVLRQACAQNQTWQQAGLPPIRVAVNLSASQFQLPDLASRIEAILQETALAADYLELEITEGEIMRDLDRAIATLEACKQLGVTIAIDDFGTGHSSFSYLQRFPVDLLKIDRAFIKDTPGSTEGTTIVRAIVNLAHTLKLKAIAEGIETPEQVALLRAMNCDYLQGFYFGRPLSAADFTALLQRQIIWALQASG